MHRITSPSRHYAVDFGQSPHVLTLSENVVSQTQTEVPDAHRSALSSQTPYLDCVGIELQKVNYAELSMTSYKISVACMCISVYAYVHVRVYVLSSCMRILKISIVPHC